MSIIKWLEKIFLADVYSGEKWFLRNPINLHYYLFYYFLVNKINFIVVKRENASKMDYFGEYGDRDSWLDHILFLPSTKNNFIDSTP